MLARLVSVVALGLLTVAGCGDDEPMAAVAYPDLDCDGARSGTFEADLDPDSAGAATPGDAIDEVLVNWSRDFDGELVTLRSGVGALLVDDRPVVVVMAHPAPAGGFWADTVHYCQPFAMEEPGSPVTAPLVAASVNTLVSCEPLPRFRLGDVEYENRQFDELVDPDDLGPVAGVIEVSPAAIGRCELVVLKDGEGSWPTGTEIYEIKGVDPAVGLTASLGNGVYLVFHATPFAAP